MIHLISDIAWMKLLLAPYTVKMTLGGFLILEIAHKRTILQEFSHAGMYFCSDFSLKDSSFARIVLEGDFSAGDVFCRTTFLKDFGMQWFFFCSDFSCRNSTSAGVFSEGLGFWRKSTSQWFFWSDSAGRYFHRSDSISQSFETSRHWIKMLVLRLSKICSPTCGSPRLIILSILFPNPRVVSNANKLEMTRISLNRVTRYCWYQIENFKIRQNDF